MQTLSRAAITSSCCPNQTATKLLVQRGQCTIILGSMRVRRRQSTHAAYEDMINTADSSDAGGAWRSGCKRRGHRGSSHRRGHTVRARLWCSGARSARGAGTGTGLQQAGHAVVRSLLSRGVPGWQAPHVPVLRTFDAGKLRNHADGKGETRLQVRCQSQGVGQLNSSRRKSRQAAEMLMDLNTRLTASCWPPRMAAVHDRVCRGPRRRCMWREYVTTKKNRGTGARSTPSPA